MADASRLVPQRGLGGDDSARVKPDKCSFSEIGIEAEGCEKMTGYLSLPQGLEEDRKYALIFVFHGNGDAGRNRVRNVAKVTTARDPVICIGTQYQQLTPEGKGKMGLPPLATPPEIIEGCDWLLAKVMREHPVDPERVFVAGFSWGTAWASAWCNKEWEEDPDSFPFRTLFLYSSGGAARRSTWPPIPVICTVGEKETAVLGRINVVRTVRHFANVLVSWGSPCNYHEIPKMGHSVNGRCLQITRDAINELGGPGAVPYPEPAGTEETPADPLPFGDSEDPLVREVMVLVGNETWAAALARIKEISKDRSIKAKAKREVRKLPRAMERFARKEVVRVHERIAAMVEAERMPQPCDVHRLKALMEAYAGKAWGRKPVYGETLAKLDADDFPPRVRERERQQTMNDAWTLETTDRAAAKALYEKLAACAEQDAAPGIWPAAARYRLMWWQDLDRRSR